MRVALGEYQIGGIKTNIPLHQRILQDPEFLVGEVHTRYLDKFLVRPHLLTSVAEPEANSVTVPA
jgi:acetyl-CoA carboxylase biotin carboxylase subunit